MTIQKKCCEKCLNSKGALSKSWQKKFGGICGTTCECHWPQHCDECLANMGDGDFCTHSDSHCHQKTKAPVSTYIEDCIRLFEEKTPEGIPSEHDDLYGEGGVDEWLKKHTAEHLYSDRVYIESMCEISRKKVIAFLRDALTRQQQLLREEVEKLRKEVKSLQVEAAKFDAHMHGWNAGIDDALKIIDRAVLALIDKS